MSDTFFTDIHNHIIFSIDDNYRVYLYKANGQIYNFSWPKSFSHSGGSAPTVADLDNDGDLEIIGFPFEHLEVPLIHLRESGAKFYRGSGSLIVRGGRCYPIDISTGPYPGINSDMQPLFAIYGLCAQGESRIIDLRFPGRYQYMEEIKKMGGQFKVEGNMLSIHGGHKLKGARVKAIDLRAGIALVLAGLVAEGETIIEDAWQIDRGYDQLSEKMSKLGLNSLSKS